MNTFETPVFRALLLLCGVATVALALGGMQVVGTDLGGQHARWLTAASGAALLVAAAVPGLRLPALGMALLVKLTYLAAWWASSAGEPGIAIAEAALALLLAVMAAAIARDARREARWNGGQSLGLET